jgi:pyrroloquinoline quinone biosynthesis protein D
MGAVTELMEIGPQTRLRLSPKVRLRHDEQSGKMALVFPESVLFLNPSGAAIVELCNGRTLSEIVAVLAQRYQVSSAQVERDVRSYLLRLSERGLLVPEKEEEP